MAGVGTLIFIVLLGVLWIFIWFKFRGSGRVKVYPLLLIARTGIKGEPFTGKISRVINYLGWPSIIVFLLSTIAFYYLALDLFNRKYIRGEVYGEEGFVPLLPGITIPFDENLLLILVAIGIAVLVHELSHALMARAVGVKVKDAGLILLAFIPGAFVEPEEVELKRASLISRLKIYSAGVSANMLTAILALITLSVLSPILYNGVLIVGVDEGAPAFIGGLREGMVVVGVNGVPIKSVDDLIRTLKELGVDDRSKGVMLEFKVVRRGLEEVIKVYKPEGFDRIGVRFIQSYSHGLLAPLLQFIFMVNTALALINAAPILIPTPAGGIASDGAHFIGDLIARVLGEKARFVITPTIGLLTLLMILSLITLTPIRITP